MGQAEKSVPTDEYRFNNQNWRRVLKEIVDFAPGNYGRGKDGYTPNHPLALRTKVSWQELGQIMMFLEDMGLIEYQRVGSEYIVVTPKGFDVALKNQENKRQFRTEMIMLFFTGVVALAAILPLFGLRTGWMVGTVAAAVLVGGAAILARIANRTP